MNGMVRVSDANYSWVLALAAETGRSQGHIVSQALDAVRTGKKFHVEPYEPTYIRKMREHHERRQKRLQRILKRAKAGAEQATA